MKRYLIDLCHPLRLSVFVAALALTWFTGSSWPAWAFCVFVVLAPVVQGFVRSLRKATTGHLEVRFTGAPRSAATPGTAWEHIGFATSFVYGVLKPLGLAGDVAIDAQDGVHVHECPTLTPERWTEFTNAVQAWGPYQVIEGLGVDVVAPYEDDGLFYGWVCAHIEFAEHRTNYTTERPEVPRG